MRNRILGQSLPNTIRDIQQSIDEFSKVPISYRGDWHELAEPMVFVSSISMRVSNSAVDLTKIFAIGDPIRYKQGGDYKYGYITKVTTNVITIRSGSDFTIINSPITDVAKGLKLNPIGFPVLFNIPNSAYSAAPGSITLSGTPSDTKTQFFMVGPVITVRVITFNATISGADSVVFLNLPAPSAEITNAFRVNYNDSVGPQWGVVKVTSGTHLEIYSGLSSGGYPVGAGNTNMNFTFDYIVGEP
jgi:hypothetical protein